MILLLVTVSNNNNSLQLFSFLLLLWRTFAVLCSSFFPPSFLFRLLSTSLFLSCSVHSTYENEKRMDEQNRLSLSLSSVFFITTIKFSSATWWERERQCNKDYTDACRYYDGQNDKRKYMAHTHIFYQSNRCLEKWQ